MTDQQHLSTLLRLIDEWIESLQDHELPEECRKSGSDFFAYMKRRGVYQGWMVDVIREATGRTPKQLWQAEDAAVLRDAIGRYEYSMTIAQNTNENPYDIIRREWN